MHFSDTFIRNPWAVLFISLLYTGRNRCKGIEEELFQGQTARYRHIWVLNLGYSAIKYMSLHSIWYHLKVTCSLLSPFKGVVQKSTLVWAQPQKGGTEGMYLCQNMAVCLSLCRGTDCKFLGQRVLDLKLYLGSKFGVLILWRMRCWISH